MNIKLYFKTLPARVAFTLVVMLVWWLAVEYWPSKEDPAPVAAGQCMGLQCTHADDTEKALQARDQLPPPQK